MAATLPVHLKEVIKILRTEVDITSAFCEVYQSGNTNFKEMTSLCEGLMQVFSSESSTLKLVEATITMEVNRTKQQNVNALFRGNNLSAKIVSNVMRTHGTNYLLKIVNPLLSLIRPAPHLFEPDPSREVYVENNSERFLDLVNTFLLSLLNTPEPFPPIIKRICNHFHTSVVEHFHACDQLSNILGGFIFLRFVCPAIISPRSFNLLKEDLPADVSRVLVLISKVLQVLANNSSLSEPYLEPVNKLIERFRKPLYHYVESQCTITKILDDEFKAEHYQDESVIMESNKIAAPVHTLLLLFQNHMDLTTARVKEVHSDPEKKALLLEKLHELSSRLNLLELTPSERTCTSHVLPSTSSDYLAPAHPATLPRLAGTLKKITSSKRNRSQSERPKRKNKDKIKQAVDSGDLHVKSTSLRSFDFSPRSQMCHVLGAAGSPGTRVGAREDARPNQSALLSSRSFPSLNRLVASPSPWSIFVLKRITNVQERLLDRFDSDRPLLTELHEKSSSTHAASWEEQSTLLSEELILALMLENVTLTSELDACRSELDACRSELTSLRALHLHASSTSDTSSDPGHGLPASAVQQAGVAARLGDDATDGSSCPGDTDSEHPPDLSLDGTSVSSLAASLQGPAAAGVERLSCGHVIRHIKARLHPDQYPHCQSVLHNLFGPAGVSHTAKAAVSAGPPITREQPLALPALPALRRSPLSEALVKHGLYASRPCKSLETSPRNNSVGPSSWVASSPQSSQTSVHDSSVHDSSPGVPGSSLPGVFGSSLPPTPRLVVSLSTSSLPISPHDSPTLHTPGALANLSPRNTPNQCRLQLGMCRTPGRVDAIPVAPPALDEANHCHGELAAPAARNMQAGWRLRRKEKLAQPPQVPQGMP